MRKLMTIFFALSVLTMFSLAAQDTTQANPNSGSAMSSGKASSITGKISDDGKTFTSDKDGKSYTISNPDAVKGHEGHHVTLKAQVSSDSSQLEVKSLKMAGGDNTPSTPQ
jgi:hypothetical protein